MVQTRGVWHPLPVNESMLLTSGASVISCIFHIQHMSWTTKSDAGPANRQPLTLSQQDGCISSDTLLVLVHLKTTHVLYEQPSVVCLWTGNVHLVDQDESWFERLSSTFSSTISASTRRGSVRRTVPSGANSWRQLCPAKDVPPNDDEVNFSDSEPLVDMLTTLIFGIGRECVKTLIKLYKYQEYLLSICRKENKDVSKKKKAKEEV